MVAPSTLIDERLEGDGVVVLTLSRPAQRNALSSYMYDALSDALTRHSQADNDTTRVVVLAGEGPSFCGGMDLKQVISVPLKQTKAARRFMFALARFPRIVVVAGNLKTTVRVC
jgi:enoyl-CoA hydratase/carnithine racemase